MYWIKIKNRMINISNLVMISKVESVRDVHTLYLQTQSDDYVLKFCSDIERDVAYRKIESLLLEHGHLEILEGE